MKVILMSENGLFLQSFDERGAVFTDDKSEAVVFDSLDDVTNVSEELRHDFGNLSPVNITNPEDLFVN